MDEPRLISNHRLGSYKDKHPSDAPSPEKNALKAKAIGMLEELGMEHRSAYESQVGPCPEEDWKVWKIYFWPKQDRPDNPADDWEDTFGAKHTGCLIAGHWILALHTPYPGFHSWRRDEIDWRHVAILIKQSCM